MTGNIQTGTAPGLGSSGQGASSREARAPLAAWYALSVLIATTLFAFVDRQVINLIAPSLQSMLGLSDLQLGALQGLGLALFASAAGYPIGWLADRFGRRIVLGCCIVLWSASTGAAAFQSTFAGLFVATAGIAVGEAALSPIIFSMLPDLFPERQRNAANFAFFAAALLGAAAGFGLGGAMLAWLGRHQHALPGMLAGMDTWRVALIVAAAPAPIFVLLLRTIRLGTGASRPARIDEPAAEVERLLPFMRAHWPVFACVYGAIAAYSLPMNSAFSWLPIAVPRIFGTPSSEVGLQMGIAAAVATIIGLLLPAVGTRLMRGDALLKPFALARLFMVVAALPTLLLAFATTPAQIYVAAGTQLTFGLGAGALMPGLLQQISPPRLRSRLISILGIVTAIVQGLSPVLVGAVSGQFPGRRGIITALVIVGLPCWVGGVLLMSRARRHFAATAAAAAAHANANAQG